MKGFSIKKFSIVVFTLAVIAIVADIAQHYTVLRLAENWLQTSEKRQNSFKSRLNIWPLGEASVEINNLVSVSNNEKLTIRSIRLRKSLLDFKEVKVLAETIESGDLAADILRGRAQRTQNETGIALVFRELELDNFALKKSALILMMPKITGNVIYKVNEKVACFALNSQKILMNEKEIAGLEVKGDLTISAPRNGEIVFKVKEIDTLSHTLVEAGYLKPNQAQILIFGGQLLSDADGRVKVKLKFKNGDIYWGPVKLKV